MAAYDIAHQKATIRTILKENDIEVILDTVEEWVNKKEHAQMRALLNDIQKKIELFNSRNCSENEIESFLKKEISELSVLFTQGFGLIIKIREFYTGERISYGYTYKRGKDLYHRDDISEAELLATIGFSGGSRMNSLIARMKVKPSYKGAKKLDGTFNKIFKQLKYLNQKHIRGAEPLTKAGFIHEVFVLITEDPKYAHWLKNPSSMYQQKSLVYDLFRQARQNTVPFYKSGDIGNVQLKLWDGAAPSLANLNTIAIVLDQYLKGQEALKNIRHAEAEKIINKLIFTTTAKEKVIDELITLGIEDAQDVVDNFINTTNINLQWNIN